MAQQHDKKVDLLLGESLTDPKITCHETSDAGVKTYFDHGSVFAKDETHVLEYRDVDYIYKIPLNPATDYPEFRYLKAFDFDGKENRRESLRLQEFYNKLHPPSVTVARVDLEDFSMACDTKKSNASTFCRLRTAAARARVTNQVQRNFCQMIKADPSSTSPSKYEEGSKTKEIRSAK